MATGGEVLYISGSDRSCAAVLRSPAVTDTAADRRPAAAAAADRSSAENGFVVDCTESFLETHTCFLSGLGLTPDDLD